MSKFIKLTNMLLNTNTIHKISIMPTKYYIHILGKYPQGEGLVLFGCGGFNLNSYEEQVEVCKEKDPVNYQIISDWINRSV
jgi:hypothetical protein